MLKGLAEPRGLIENEYQGKDKIISWLLTLPLDLYPVSRFFKRLFTSQATGLSPVSRQRYAEIRAQLDERDVAKNATPGDNEVNPK
jgi:hypothetical protein